MAEWRAATAREPSWPISTKPRSEEYGHIPYTPNLLALFGVVYPALRPARDFVAHAEDRLAHFRNEVLHRAHAHEPVLDADHHMFCSEWVGTVYARLGISKPEFDPHVAAPVTPLLRGRFFADPVYLESEGD